MDRAAPYWLETGDARMLHHISTTFVGREALPFIYGSTDDLLQQVTAGGVKLSGTFAMGRRVSKYGHLEPCCLVCNGWRGDYKPFVRCACCGGLAHRQCMTVQQDYRTPMSRCPLCSWES